MLAALASFIFCASASAGVPTGQTVSYDTGSLTWNGGQTNTPNAADDVVTFTEDSETDGTVTVHTTSDDAITLIGGDSADCTGDGTDTIVCTGVNDLVANAGTGADSVDASGLRTVESTLNADAISDGSADTLKGGAADDQLNSIDGGDTLEGNGGNDDLNGGDGADSLNGGDGDDELYGNGGADTINAGANNDYAEGGAAADTINGDAGNDELYGSAPSIVNGEPAPDGADTINGGDDNDYISGGDDNDVLNGNGGIDEINGDDGNDQIDGGAGDDAFQYFGFCCIFSAEAGADLFPGGSIDGGLFGDDGNDTINGGDGVDYADGGSGSDTVNGNGDSDRAYGCFFGRVSAPAAPDPESDGCGFAILGGLAGGSGDDTVHGNDGDDYIGGQYSDLVADALTQTDAKSAGSVSTDGDPETDNDNLFGDAGYDYMRGDSGNDVMDGGTEGDSMYGDDGLDTMDGSDGVDYMDGGNDADTVNGGPGDDAPNDYYDGGNPDGGLYGGDGNDTVNGGPGIDLADGGNDSDTVNGGDGNDSRQFVSCPDEVTSAGFGGNICTVIYGGLNGGNGEDTVNGDAGNDYVYGGDDNDNVNGGAGNDEWELGANVTPASYYSSDPGVYGGDGDDTVHGDAGNDYVSGDEGVDNTSGDDGDDNVNEWDDGSVDVAHGNGGNDSLWYSAYSCCEQLPVTITLDDVADDGQAPSSDPEGDPGDPGNNFASDIENAAFDTNCNGDACTFAMTALGAPVKLVGNSSANVLIGSVGNDDITGGDGADYLDGNAGDDTIHARDGYPDFVLCGDGTDTAIVDQFDTLQGCEPENVDKADVKSAFDLDNPPVAPTPPVAPANVTAPPKDETAPKVTLSSKATVTDAQLVAGVKVSFACNEECALNLRLLAQQAPGTATFARVKGYNVVIGRRTVGFGKSKRDVRVRPCERKPGGAQSKPCLKRFKRALNARLDKAGKVTMKLYAVTTDRAGNRTTTKKTITIKRKRK